MASTKGEKNSDNGSDTATELRRNISVLPSHCPYRQATLIQQALAPDKMRVAFFIGAGCPTSIRIPDGSATRPLIPDIAGLTARIRQALEASTSPHLQ